MKTNFYFMKKFLLTNRGHDTLWSIPDCKRVVFKDFSDQDLLVPSTRSYSFPLPLEIVIKIIDALFWTFAANNSFDMIFQLCKLNTAICTHLFKNIFPGFRVDFNIRKMGTVCRLLQDIYDEYISAELFGEETLVLHLNRSRKGALKNEIWNFDPNFDLWTSSDEVVTDIIKCYNGVTNGDVVWVKGSIDQYGVMKCQNMFHPIFVFNFRSFHSVPLLVQKKRLPRSIQKFARFLEKVYGPLTGVFAMMKREIDAENPFITETDLIVKI